MTAITMYLTRLAWRLTQKPDPKMRLTSKLMKDLIIYGESGFRMFATMVPFKILQHPQKGRRGAHPCWPTHLRREAH